jgi:hypothetical protein
MNEQDFYIRVGATEFSERYYALCRRYSVRDVPLCQLSNGIVVDLLSQLGRKVHRDPRDNSFQRDQNIKGGVIHSGFVIQKHSMVEFWFWLDQIGHRIGSNFSVIAYESAKWSGKLMPSPPYPKPEFHSENELRAILSDCFNLADDLSSIVQGDG